MSKSPAFQFYPKDFLSDGNVALMDDHEIGMYILLMCHCWLEGSLPNSEEDLAKIARSTPKKFKKSWKKRIRKCFTETENSEIIHPRLEKEREKQKSYKAKKAEAGRKGAQKRWKDHNSANGTANGKDIAVPEVDNSTANDMPVAENGSSSPSPSTTADNNPPSPPVVRARVNGKEIPEHQRPVSGDPPDIEDVVQFFKNNGSDEKSAKLFFNHYDSQNWQKSNKMPISSWYSAARKWIDEDRFDPPKWKNNNKSKKRGSNGESVDAEGILNETEEIFQED